jgi:ABC-type antimicrobial peptide transport system permease subunit
MTAQNEMPPAIRTPATSSTSRRRRRVVIGGCRADLLMSPSAQFLVTGRRREIGIRMALGADRSAVRTLIFGSALRFVLAGTVMGLAAAAVAVQAIAAQLFGVAPVDPATYAGVAALVAVTAILATWWPARRAAAVDPAVTLRAE